MPTVVLERRFKPGDAVPESGVYRVFHSRHRAPHDNSFVEGDLFPPCRRCGQDVRFQLLASALARSTRDSKPSLLVVDYEPTVSVTLKKVLERDGYHVSTAANFGAAMALLDRRNYDAVITEVDLEANAKGLELIRALRARKPAPVIIVSTAEPTVTKLRPVLGLRVNYLVVKPIDLAELRSALQRMIARRSAELEFLAAH